MSSRYRALLHLLPRRFRRRFGDDMTRLFQNRLEEVEGSPARVFRVWILAIADLLRHGIAERFEDVRRATFASSLRPSRPAPTRPVPPSRRESMLDLLIQDLRHAVRAAFRRPLMTAIIAATLALGVGASTAMFSVVNAVLLRSLPYPEADRLMFLQEESESGQTMTVSYPNFVDWREQARSFDALVATTSVWGGGVYNLERPIPVRRMGVSEGFFDVIAGGVALGRPLAPEEIAPGGEPALVVSHRFWSRHLGGETALEGLALEMGSGVEIPVVGVMRPDFRFVGDVDVWFPLPAIDIRNAHNYLVVGRLEDGASPESARQEMSAIAAGLRAEYPDSNGAADVEITPLRGFLVGDVSSPLWLLLGASGLLLLLACTNVAGTLLARGLDRGREISVRRAVGAGRGRIVGQLLVESLFLATVGVVAGFVVAYAAVELLGAMAASRIPRFHEVGVDVRVLSFGLATIVTTALVFGLFPAIRLSGSTSVDLSSWSRTGEGRGASRSWVALVSMEVALAVVLLLGSGLMTRSLLSVLGADVGYDREGVVSARFSLPQTRYGEGEQRVRFLDRLRRRAMSQPGIEAFGLAGALPFDTGYKTGPLLKVPYTDPEAPDEWDAQVRFRVVDAGYFETLGIEVFQGRSFEPRDRADHRTVAIVNRSLAGALWPDENPVGERVRALWDFRGADMEVVGVVAEARHWNRAPGTQYEVYVPWYQRPEHASEMVAVLRGPASVDVLAARIRDIFEEMDPDLLVTVQTMDEILHASLGDRNFILTVLGAFSVVGLLLALAGIYAVVTQSVARRTREIGIRVALGAEPSRVRALVGRRAFVGTGLGLAIGVVAALGAGRFLGSLLYEITPTDPVTYLAILGLLLTAAAVAAWIPARRATRVDPMEALRRD